MYNKYEIKLFIYGGIMHLSKFTDYSFRILIFLGSRPNELFTVEELSSILDLSAHHVKKIIYKLVKNNYLESSKGRNGGIKFVVDPKDINLGELFEIMEDNLNIVECFSNENKCCINHNCRLRPILNDSLKAFKTSLSKYTLNDII